LRDEFETKLRSLSTFFVNNDDLLAVLTEFAQRHLGRGLEGQTLYDALEMGAEKMKDLLADVQSAAEAMLSNLKMLATDAGNQTAPQTQANAGKQASTHLSFLILHYLATHGLLGERPPTSDRDPIVHFAQAVIDIVEDEKITVSAVRTRLSAQFDRAKQLASRRPPDLVPEREAHAKWVADAADEYRKDPKISDADARSFAEGLPLDLALDPREAARRDMASWAADPQNQE